MTTTYKPGELTFNENRGRVEARFYGIPTANARGILKAQGFRWDPRAGVWWLASPPIIDERGRFFADAEGKALQIVTASRVCVGDLAEIKRASDFHHVKQAELGMEIACGIA